MSALLLPPDDEQEEEISLEDWASQPPGDCGYNRLNGPPHSGPVHRVEYMCVHEHWTGNDLCEAHLADPGATWWPCGRCAHDSGRCPTIVHVIGTGHRFRLPAAGTVIR